MNLSLRKAAMLAATLCACACAPPPPGPIERYMSVIDPGGGEPRAGVVLVPGCDGPGRNVAAAAESLAGDGFVVLTLDYPAAYVRDGGCSTSRVARMAGDVVRAANRLRELPDVDPARIHLVGWAEGGAGVMQVLGDPDLARQAGARAAATLYPTCAALGSKWHIGVPFLMLLGEADKIAPPQHCIAIAENAVGAERILAIRYGGAGHAFDAATTGGFFSSAASGDPRLREAALQDIRLFFGSGPAAPSHPAPVR